ncbi:hypothetical protein E1B28_008810 [Marasmius oreades]|uniref:Uncharacterized protein n=1 Tax=Marasmius oreades TaxID=181124 RepID=A0A9P7RZ57_9AGAR|nr:uncharacterized protein E1B28_008810 [Marasmius oreades]KAG7092456.1 hypothetical protein E1B28_008810 [Marasmius oreades]
MSTLASAYIPSKINTKPKRHHGYAVILFILGTLFPPLAVAARFGIGTDFWINLVLTICGYIPGHGHNFYIQNIRNNKTHARTPKWAQKWGLVDTSEIRRKERKSQWANRYKDRLPSSTLEGQPYEEGQVGNPSMSISSDGDDGRPNRQPSDGLWREEDEQYYNNPNNSNSSGRWHYPANFDDAVAPKSSSKRGTKKKEKKDRWARTEDAYNLSDQREGKKSKRRKSRASVATSIDSTGGSTQFPEDPEGGLYGPVPGEGVADEPSQNAPKATGTTDEDVFSHQF